MSSVKQTASAQQVIDRLAERWAKASRLPANCTLGANSRRRRGGACSGCPHPQEFEIDRAIAQFIDSAAFKRAGVCPYQVVASHLVAGLTLGPDVSRARSAGRARVDPVVEVKGVLKRIRSLLYTTGPSRDDIEAIAISNHDDWWQALLDAGLDTEVKALVSSSGVSMYITKEATADTLRRLAGLASGSIVIMTFMLPLELVDDADRPGLEAAARGAQASGTPWLSFFPPDEILELARDAGFNDAETVSTADLAERYLAGRTDGLSAAGGEAILVART